MRKAKIIYVSDTDAFSSEWEVTSDYDKEPFDTWLTAVEYGMRKAKELGYRLIFNQSIT